MKKSVDMENSVDMKKKYVKKVYALPKRFLRGFGGRVEPMADMRRYTSWKIGGAADWLLEPADEQQVLAVLDLVRNTQLPLLVIGRGSNLLVSDRGIAGVVLRIGEAFSGWRRLNENHIEVGAGEMLANVSRQTAAAGLSGLEWACGIPGNVGGALAMNAGAYGSSMDMVVTAVRVAAYNEPKAKKAVIRTLAGADLQFGGYRNGCVGAGLLALAATLRLGDGDAEELLAQIKETIATRAKNQPLEYPSAGSVFKNPEGSHAGFLVESAGLKGWRVGDAEVSQKHGNFIVNRGAAKAADVLALIERVQEAVLEQTGYQLECEVRLVGREMA